MSHPSKLNRLFQVQLQAEQGAGDARPAAGGHPHHPAGQELPHRGGTAVSAEALQGALGFLQQRAKPALGHRQHSPAAISTARLR
jgi:hypothetical protein